MKRLIFAAACFVCVLATSGYAAVPTSISVQGRLTDASGNPLPPGFKVLTFKVFNASAGGTEIWPLSANEEDQFINSDGAGLWSASVGRDIPLTNQVFADTVRWLEVKVDDGVNPPVTMPRIRLVTGAYAFRVATVDGASGGSITSKVSIGPGHTNSGVDAFVAGNSNDATGHYSAIGGGQDNVASGSHSTIGGGRRNVASNFYSTVGGGDADTASSPYATVGGGQTNTASGEYSIIGGGSFNVTSGDHSTISGGQSNVASGRYSAVGGGSVHEASGRWATVAGGQNNHATDTASTVGGGRNNIASGSYATVGGGGGAFAGDRNEAYGDYSTIPGGSTNGAGGRFSFAAGRSAKATHTGAFVWGDSTDSDFTSTAENQFLIRASGGVGIGTNDPDGALEVRGGNTILDINLGIGTEAPEGPLHVLESSAGTATANTASTAVFERNSTNYISVLSPDANERGILFGEPSNAAAGGIVYNPSGIPDGLSFRTGGNNNTMQLDAVGNLLVDGCVDGNNTACASDARLKKNISTVHDALDLVGKLRGVSYEWRTEQFPDRHFESGSQYGVVAQEVREVLPEVIREREDGYLSVEYNGFIPVLIEAIKEQQKIINRQNERITNLEQKLEQ